MNMTTTRLDDKLNTVLIGAAIALLVGLGLDVSGGASFGRNGNAPDVALAKATVPALEQRSIPNRTPASVEQLASR